MLSFNIGASTLADTTGRQRYFLLGGSTLSHEMGRTWTSSVSYLRDLNFSSLYHQPVLADTVTALMGGLITSRLSFQSGASYSRGSVGLVGPNRGLVLASGLVGLQTAVTRYLALGMNYSVYYRTIGSQVVVPSDLARRTETQAVRVYLSTWMPLFSRTRRSNAAR